MVWREARARQKRRSARRACCAMARRAVQRKACAKIACSAFCLRWQVAARCYGSARVWCSEVQRGRREAGMVATAPHSMRGTRVRRQAAGRGRAICSRDVTGAHGILLYAFDGERRRGRKGRRW